MNYLDYEGLLRYHELMDAKKQDTIDSSHKLSADLVDDTSTTNKFVTANDKQTWNEKQDALTFNTTPSSSNKVATMADIPANTDTTYTLAAGTGDDANKIVLTPSSGDALKVTVPYASNAGTAINVSGTIAIANGGTGATSASAARTNLGLGTASTKDVASSGDASNTQVVMGNDSRLANNVKGIESSINQSLAIFDGTSGKLLKQVKSIAAKETTGNCILDLGIDSATDPYEAVINIRNGNGGTSQIMTSTSATTGSYFAFPEVSSTSHQYPATIYTTKNKPSYTANDVGLGNVTNESKATMFTDAALTGTPTAPTATAGTNTTQIATTAFVKSAVDTATAGLTGAMHFKGTKESLPSTTTGYSDGDVILFGTKEYVANGNSWVELGDESSFALKTTTVTGTGVLSGGGALSANQTITHNTSGVTSGLYGSVSGNSVNIPLITVDSYGHITAATNTGFTIPSIPTLSKSDSGSGNIVTSISVSGHEITVTKGATALLSEDIGSISYGTVGSSTLDTSKDIDKLFIS